MAIYPHNWRNIRRRIIKRDGKRCYYCGETDDLVVHHLRPINQGGNHKPYNLITLCRSCHQSEHKSIRAFGLCIIPGPDFEPYRNFLTNREDVLRYADFLDQTGFDGSYLRSLCNNEVPPEWF